MMIRIATFAALIAVTMGGLSAPAMAASCKDAKGKFTKCPVAAPAAPAARCKDSKGKFAKCGAPGAVPIK